MTGTDHDMWGMADYGPLGDRLAPAGRHLVEVVAPGAGERVLDVAAGLGTTAEVAVARGATVVAVDGSPTMVARGRERLAGLGDAVRWLEGDLAALPVPDGSVDVALSSFGLIFTSRPTDALAELHRVLVPGGRLAFTAWTRDGVMARMTREMGHFLPAPAPDAAPGPDPFAWGEPDQAVRLLGAHGFVDVRAEVAALPWSFTDPAAMTTFFRRHSPAHAASAAAAGDAADAMFRAVEAVFSPDGGPVDASAEYLVVTAQRSPAS
jgi:SAM-dependent methyltransferase